MSANEILIAAVIWSYIIIAYGFCKIYRRLLAIPPTIEILFNELYRHIPKNEREKLWKKLKRILDGNP